MWFEDQNHKKVQICSNIVHKTTPKTQWNLNSFPQIEQQWANCTQILSSSAAALSLSRSASLTCALCQRGAQAHLDVVYPNVSSGAVSKETFHHHLPWRDRGREEREEVRGRRGERGPGTRVRRRRKTIKSLYAAFDFNAASAPLLASSADFFMRTLTACDVPDAYSDAYRDIVTYFSLFQSQTWPEVTEGLKEMMLSCVPRCFSFSKQLW